VKYELPGFLEFVVVERERGLEDRGERVEFLGLWEGDGI
jgi:hypothetical protein